MTTEYLSRDLKITTDEYTVNGADGAGLITIKNQLSIPSAPAGGVRVYSVNDNLCWRGSQIITIDCASLTSNRILTLPDTSGTLTTNSVSATLTNKTLLSATNSVDVTSLRGININNTLPTVGQVLSYNGSEWIALDEVGGMETISGGEGILVNASDPANPIIINNAPDQTLSLTTESGISITGTYPNFTITNSLPDQVVTLSAGSGISITGTYPNFTITNTSPEQTITLTAGSANTTITGSFPNFTIASAAGGGTVIPVPYWSRKLNWTSVDFSSTTWQSTAWSPELNLAAAVSNSNEIKTSPDGVVWTSRSSPGSGFQFQDVCWSPDLSLFVAIAFNLNSGKSIIKSSDGITWSYIATSSLQYLRSVCWSPELSLFVAVAQIATSGNIICTSEDGNTWVSRGAVGDSWFRIIWVSELSKFIATGGGSIRAMTSSDGINWTGYTMSTNGYGLAWSPKLNLLVAASSGEVSVSSNGSIWTRYTSVMTTDCTYLIWIQELSCFIAVGASGNLSISQNGITWAINKNIGSASNITTITWVKKLWCLMGTITGGAIKGTF